VQARIGGDEALDEAGRGLRDAPSGNAPIAAMSARTSRSRCIIARASDATPVSRRSSAAGHRVMPVTVVILLRIIVRRRVMTRPDLSRGQGDLHRREHVLDVTRMGQKIRESSFSSRESLLNNRPTLVFRIAHQRNPHFRRINGTMRRPCHRW